ncbi:MAG: hypothetical protein IPK72_02400 [Candidatus Eisenbacteria bacterium]|nr:hypothetical protein [Candidatus Eisenbacteria bacterium]
MIDRIHSLPRTVWSRTLVHAGLVLIAVVGASAAGIAGGSALAEGPDSQPGPNPVDPSLVPALPEIPWTWLPVGPLELRFADPFGPEDKGGTYTDMGGLGENRLTQREVALLELSRAAVEASRLAGTLGVGAPIGPRTPADPAGAARLKEDMVRARVSRPVSGTGGPADPALTAGDPLGATPSAPLTPAEAEKLALARAQQGAIEQPGWPVPYGALVQLPAGTPVAQPEGAPRPTPASGEPKSDGAQPTGKGE